MLTVGTAAATVATAAAFAPAMTPSAQDTCIHMKHDWLATEMVYKPCLIMGSELP